MSTATSTNANTFGDYLAALIRRSGMTMAEFAEAVGTNASSLSRIRNGRRMPRTVPIDRWADTLECSEDEHRTLRELVLVAQAPAELQARLIGGHAPADTPPTTTSPNPHNTTATKNSSQLDGYWLAYNHHFHSNGEIACTLCHITGTTVRWLIMDRAQVHYSYTGQFEHLGDKIFMRLAEDRGASEYIQVTCDALFDYQAPAFLYGLVTGISGRSVRHPVSRPCAARMMLLFVGRAEDIGRDPDRFDRLQHHLGSRLAEDCGPFFPDWLGNDKAIRQGLQLRPREDLDAVIMRLLDNHLPPGDTVLTSGFH